MKPRLKSFSWDQFVVLIVSIIGLSLSESPSPFSTSKVGRGLASLTSRASDEIDVIDLGCMDFFKKKETYFRKQNLVRFKGRLCSPHSLIQFNASLKVTNSSNGKSGVVFIQDKDHLFLSSEISLLPGENSIHIEWQDGLSGTTKSRIAQVFKEPI
ncbi:MAG: hypothetical protein ACKN9V_01090 [Pseudomonadota bacterium]